MACIGCGFELSPGFAFCPRCGRRQPTRLSCVRRSRARLISPSAHGAGGPGAQTRLLSCPCAEPEPCRSPRPGPGGLTRASPAATPDALHREADRRQVTVLFADVSGFTALAERLDPEEVRAFQNALFETLAQAIARYDGFVEKFVGDAVLAVFGAPVAHEDDPERALDAALDMLGRSARLSERWAVAARPAREPSHRRPHRPGRGRQPRQAAGAAYAVTGDTVNTTARLLCGGLGHHPGLRRHLRADPASLRLRAGRRTGAARQGRSRSWSIACSARSPNLGRRAGLRPTGSRPRWSGAPTSSTSSSRPSTGCSGARPRS